MLPLDQDPEYHSHQKQQLDQVLQVVLQQQDLEQPKAPLVLPWVQQQQQAHELEQLWLVQLLVEWLQVQRLVQSLEVVQQQQALQLELSPVQVLQLQGAQQQVQLQLLEVSQLQVQQLEVSQLQVQRLEVLPG
jgi:predicted DNA-binding protein (UPF0251 family)